MSISTYISGRGASEKWQSGPDFTLRCATIFDDRLELCHILAAVAPMDSPPGVQFYEDIVKADDLLTAFLSLERDTIAAKEANGNATRMTNS